MCLDNAAKSGLKSTLADEENGAGYENWVTQENKTEKNTLLKSVYGRKIDLMSSAC